MRVSRASEERRQEILDAAMQVFYLKGYEKATIRDIALDIGVAQGLISVSYTHLDVYKRQASYPAYALWKTGR